MFSIKPACNDLPINICLKKRERKRKYCGNKKLGSIGVWTGICHGGITRLGVLQFEVFVSEFFAVD